MRGATLTSWIALVSGCCMAQAFLVPRPGTTFTAAVQMISHRIPLFGLEGLSVPKGRQDGSAGRPSDCEACGDGAGRFTVGTYIHPWVVVPVDQSSLRYMCRFNLPPETRSSRPTAHAICFGLPPLLSCVLFPSACIQRQHVLQRASATLPLQQQQQAAVAPTEAVRSVPCRFLVICCSTVRPNALATNQQRTKTVYKSNGPH